MSWSERDTLRLGWPGHNWFYRTHTRARTANPDRYSCGEKNIYVTAVHTGKEEVFRKSRKKSSSLRGKMLQN